MARRTKKGIIVNFNKDTKMFYLYYPEGKGDRYGGVNFAKLMGFFFYLYEGFSIDKADELAFGKK